MKRITLAWFLVALTFGLTFAPAALAADDRTAPVRINSNEQVDIDRLQAALETQRQADLAAAEARSELRGTLRGAPASGLGVTPAPQMKVDAMTTGGPYVCLPSCSEIDGRFLSLAGTGFNTLAGDEIVLELSAPASATAIEVGIFDPDTGGLWDLGSFGAGLGLQADLYADPNGDASGFLSKGSWTFDTSYASYDNGWYTITIPTGNDAEAASGNYFYTLHIKNPTPAAVVSTNFKIRTDGALALKPQAFAFMVPMLSIGAAEIIYPSYPALSPTTYDGRFDIHFLIPAGQKPRSIELWDGDMDFGAADCTAADTNDSDTPGSPFLPSWAIGTAAVPEGVAVGNLYGTCFSTGAPADNTLSTLFLRSPHVSYSVNTPDGGSYSNGNPSGNLEWEKFRMYRSSGFPAGVYHIDLVGVDMANLNAWRFPYDVACVKETTGANGELIPCDTVYCPCCGTGTIGYWKNHSSSWPRPLATVGGAEYTVSQAITVMKYSTSGDKTYGLFSQLVAAMMNVYLGNDSTCISADIDAANAWLALHPVGSNVAASSAAWGQISASFGRLDQYNNGNLCAPHRDDVSCGGNC